MSSIITHDPAVHYLATIHECPLLWDDRAGGPWWPEGEPEIATYEPNGSITIEPQCDVYRVMPHVRVKTMDCGHAVRSGEPYLTWIAESRDECLSCASAEGRR